MATAAKTVTKVPADIVAGATNFKMIGSVIIGVSIGIALTGTIMYHMRKNEYVKKVQEGIAG